MERHSGPGGLAGGQQAVPAVMGLRRVFSARISAGKLRSLSRVETTESQERSGRAGPRLLYYDFIDLCRLKDPNKNETAKLDYLFRGLKPTLDKIWSKKP